jgi:hypothetical protein
MPIVVIACYGAGPVVPWNFSARASVVETAFVDGALGDLRLRIKAQSARKLFALVLTCRVTHVTRV